MKALKNLAGQTMIYGLGTMVPRLLNYIILTPYFTRLYNTEDSLAEYGKVTELYAFVVFLMIILTYGMETAYFRYSSIEKDKKKVFSTIFTSILSTSILFVVLVYFYSDSISSLLKYEGESYFIQLLTGIVCVEAISAIPFAKLRIENKAKRFAILRLVQVVFNVLLVVSIYNIIPLVIGENTYLLNGKNIVSSKYIFVANLFSSCIILFLLLPELKDFSIRKFSFNLYKQIIFYGLPLMLSGLAGVINETLDRSIFKHLIGGDEGLSLLGVYGANYKLASIVMISVQMFRYAAEPFFFNYEKEKDSKETYANIMNLFTAILVLLVLGLLLFLDIFKIFIDKQYHEGLNIVPIIALAYIFYGILFNLSIWFKLSNKTNFAIIITLIGAMLTIIINLIFVPKYSYNASAYAHVISYGTMVVVSYFLGKKFYPIPYKLSQILVYFVTGFAIYFIDQYIEIGITIFDYLFKLILLLLFTIFVVWKENLLKILFNRRYES